MFIILTSIGRGVYCRTTIAHFNLNYLVRMFIYYTPVLEQTTNTESVSRVQYSCDPGPV